MPSQEKILNKEQLEAIQHGDRPLLIIAGAGTGKTTVVTERVKWLVSSGKAKPSEILALTFTEKAAREMEERVDVAMPMGYTQMWISTFHSFGDRILRQEALNIGLDPHFNLLSEAEVHLLLKKHLYEFELDYFRPHGNPTKFISGMLQHFSRLKDEDVSPQEYLRWVNSRRPETDKEEIKKNLELAKAYQKYETLKIKNSLMDFSDLIVNTLKLFRTRPAILKRHQAQFKYLLVDEFQDTNIAQNELVILLAGRKANLTAVADDDQAIYKWRGASVSNVLQFRKQFPKAKIVVLIKNYRSTQTILDQAYQLIQNNNPDRLETKEKINKKLTAARNPKAYKTCFFYLDRVENEAEAAAKEIKKLTLDQKKYDFRDVAILVRANAHAEPFTQALHRFGIPYQFLGPGRLLKQPEIKELIAYLKVLSDLGDNVAFYSILTMDHFQISPRSSAAVVSFAKRHHLSLFEAAETALGQKTENNWVRIALPKDDLAKLEKVISMINRHLKLIPKETAGQILYFFLEDAGLLKKLTEYQTATEEKKALNISRFFDRLKTYETGHKDASVYAVCDWLDLSLEMGESPLAAETDWTENNAVNLLTVHSSKGLEFPVVFLVNLVPQRFPTRERQEQIPIPEDLVKEILPEGDSHLQEERRLFYVGITRARDRLYFTAARYYGEGKLKRQVSPFVFEALGNKIEPEKQESGEQLGLLEWSRQPIKETHGQTLPRQIDYLSYSQLETYNRCPRQYKYRHLLRIPVPSSAAASFGTSIHTALRDFYAQVLEKKRPTEKDLLQLLKINWQPEGYLSRAHQKKAFREAEKMLAGFYQIAYSPRQQPIALEEIFTLRIDPSLKIGGRIDRVDQLGDNRIEIIDYKTGKPATQKEVDQNPQMTVYAMAAASPGIYKKDPAKIVLSFYFLNNQEKISTQRNQPQLEAARKKILEKAKEIRVSRLEPKPGRHCDFCEYKLLCEAWR